MMGRTLKLKDKAGKKKGIGPFGTLALAMFWLVIVSGVLLAIPFDVSTPYLSISKMLVGNPWASFTRNFHFWGSQLFLILSLVHIYDHFHHKKKMGLKKGMAFRLSLGVIIIFLAMLTGFLLKGDIDSQQARRILETLAQGIPIIGKSLAYSLLGNPNDYQLIYVHHMATFTVFITLVMIEHSRSFWPSAKDFVLSFVAVTFLSYFFSAPLHDNLNPTVKGPWYFVGFQEILHWLSHPGWALLLFLVVTILIFIVNSGRGKYVFFSKRILLVFTGFYLILTIIGLFFRGENWKWAYPWEAGYTYHVLHNFKSPGIHFFPEFETEKALGSAEVYGRKESCLVCHDNTSGFTSSHNPATIGCFSCHGGNPFATSKKQAHKKMISIPGNLVTAKQTCGTTQCHPEIVERVPTGLMATLSGIISVDHFVFNETDDPDILSNVNQLGNSAVDEHLKNLCVRCHLGNPKADYGPIDETSRGGGCLACHLNYSQEAMSLLPQAKTALINQHPEISLKVTNNHCFGCHSRSGRIATNFEGWHETTLEPAQMVDSTNFRLVEGNRVFAKQQADIHHLRGMECIDCHHSYELMGDGKHYAHEEDQEDVQCMDCHFEGTPKTISAEGLDSESAIIAALRFGNSANKQFLATNKQGHALINTAISNDSVYLLTKNSGQKLELKPPAEVCARTKAHQKLSCSSCHSSWAPSCVGCHNAYDPDEPGYDMLKDKEKTGSWVEYIGTYEAKLPALGVRTIKDDQEIIPVTPGMILTIDKSSYTHEENDSLIFHRLFAPIAPHTTTAVGRSCKSCHNNPVALGFGEGQLEFNTLNGKGKWVFDPMYEATPNDQLPGDAWIGFLQNRENVVSTRKNVAPFDIDRQKKILTVGACLTCHNEGSAVMAESLYNFDNLLKQMPGQCILPDWE